MEKVLFVSNETYLNHSNREGGVRNCTYEFIDLLKTKFEVIPFPIHLHISLQYRIRVKLGLNQYNDFNVEAYKLALQDVIAKNDIRYVYLNMSNTITFAPMLKEMFGKNVKIILCSHGNESGDYLHEAVRFRNNMGWIKRYFSSYALGKLLIKESLIRNNHLDMVLSISEVEDNIEKWLGAPITFMVPRIIKQDFIDWKPIINHVGFIGDLSHLPNQYGVLSICEALSKKTNHSIEFRLVGGPEAIGKSIASKYSFVHYCGYLPEGELLKEVSEWAFFLNLVFYYSRGVSTKLAKALSWGLPVITTTAGNRGYPYIGETLPKAETPDEMAELIIQIASDVNSFSTYHQTSVDLVKRSPNFEIIMSELYPHIEKL